MLHCSGIMCSSLSAAVCVLHSSSSPFDRRAAGWASQRTDIGPRGVTALSLHSIRLVWMDTRVDAWVDGQLPCASRILCPCRCAGRNLLFGRDRWARWADAAETEAADRSTGKNKTKTKQSHAKRATATPSHNINTRRGGRGRRIDNGMETDEREMNSGTMNAAREGKGEAPPCEGERRCCQQQQQAAAAGRVWQQAGEAARRHSLSPHFLT